MGEILRFANCELDLARIVLRRDGNEVKLEPRAFDVLAYLVQHRGAVVRKEELLDEVWGDRFVTESALTTRIKAVRQAVDDDGVRQAIIRTVHGRGYEFVAPVVTAEDGDGDTATPAASAGGAGPGAAVQPLIGRESLVARLVDALATQRLLTLVGPGGVGKTALGLELARSVAPNYPDGVYVVELVRVVDEEATSAALATAIDVSLRRSSSIDDAIVEMLRPRHSLLVLDNCEHLIEPVAALVERILREAPSVSIVATSREPLAVAGEHVWSVEPLDTVARDDASEAAMAPAVALFVARARAADPRFALDEITTPIVVEICRRLDGIPLAIELAAARTRSLGVTEVAQRLDARFALLKAMRRGGNPRHRTMHDAVSWSYDMLDDDEQQLFTALSVFAGSFDLGSAEALSPEGDALDVLTRLTERSMLTVRPQSGGAIRYELLETLRAYGRTRLDDDRALELFRAHATHFAADAAAVAEEVRGPGEPAAMERAESSFADMRAAQRFALEIGDLDHAFGLIASLREFAMRAMRYEVFAWADAACRVPGALEHPLAPTLTGISAYGAFVRGEFDLGVAQAERARELEQELGVAPSGLPERVLANLFYLVDRRDLGNVEGDRQMELALESGNDSRVVHASYMYAVGLSSDGKYDAAKQFVARAREYAERTQAPTDLASAATAQAFASSNEADALEAFLTADRIARSAGNRWMSAFAYTEASGLRVARGELDEGCTGLAEMLALWFRAGDWSQQWHTLSRCVIALHRAGNLALAMELIGTIETYATLGVAPMTAILHDAAVATRDTLICELGDERAMELRTAGATSAVETIVQRTRRALLNRTP